MFVQSCGSMWNPWIFEQSKICPMPCGCTQSELQLTGLCQNASKINKGREKLAVKRLFLLIQWTKLLQTASPVRFKILNNARVIPPFWQKTWYLPTAFLKWIVAVHYLKAKQGVSCGLEFLQLFNFADQQLVFCGNKFLRLWKTFFLLGINFRDFQEVMFNWNYNSFAFSFKCLQSTSKPTHWYRQSFPVNFVFFFIVLLLNLLSHWTSCW